MMGMGSVLDASTMRVETIIKEVKIDNGSKERPSNKRTVTNLCVFRIYILNYLNHFEKISKNPQYRSIVGENEPNEKGVGINILAYYAGTDIDGYNIAIGDIMDHLFAVIHEFDLNIFQLPSDTTNSREKGLKYISQD